MVKSDARLAPLTLIEVQLRRLTTIEDPAEYDARASELPELVAQYQTVAAVDSDITLANDLQEIPDFDHAAKLNKLAADCAQRIAIITGE